ncbi:MAG: cellulase family glycosylhydrolase [Bacillota bacterium]
MNFITRTADKLYDGESEFRFVSLNVPSLTIGEDPVWHRVNEFEQEDAIKTIAQMRGKVLRVYCFAVSGCAEPKSSYHINAPGEFNEELFCDFDRMLMLCNKHGIRVIVPFVDNWHWWGGIKEWAAFRGKSVAEFYTDSAVKADFKQFIHYVLNRRNTLTGVQYKDDPAIMCWESGNELEARENDLPALTAWTREMAAYLKLSDSNHLVMDGRYWRWSPPVAEILHDENIDILTVHYYPDQPLSYADSIRRDVALCQGLRPLVLGEFGMIKSAATEQLLIAGLECGVNGILAWSLRFKNKDGGFYWHHEVHPEDDVYNSLHWPGFASNAGCEERQMLHLFRRYAFLIDGLTETPIPAPDAPQLLPITAERKISWRGSVGAEYYELQRKEASTANWTTIAVDLSDGTQPFLPYSDNSAAPDKPYDYRLRAINASGKSPWSAIGSTIHL